VFTPEELRAGAAVCIIGSTLHRELFQNSPDILGQHLRVKAFSCEIVGLLGSKGQGAFGNDQDDMVLIPLKTLQRRVTGNTRVTTLLVSMAEDSDPERVKSSLRDLLRDLRKLAPMDEDNFNVLDTKQLADTFSGTTRVMTSLLGAVAGPLAGLGAAAVRWTLVTAPSSSQPGAGAMQRSMTAMQRPAPAPAAAADRGGAAPRRASPRRPEPATTDCSQGEVAA
jgi:hypothetical protein